MTARHTLQILVLILLAAIAAGPARAQVAAVNEQTSAGNKPERVQWFAELGFGLFIHWSVDSQLGSVISHSLVGADDDYCRRYFTKLPKMFHPRRFDADEWAELARLAGFRYVVFTAKHHSGFCMFPSETTTFDIASTPFERDVTGELIRAFRKQGIAVGLYFSPDDFWFLWKQGTTISRRRAMATPQENQELMAYDQAQIRELLTNYGPIDVFFIDGPAEGLRELCWKLQPNIVVTRGAMQTPEQYVPGIASKDPWEANMTMGTQWQYKPTNESYKSGTEVIERLIETRSKGGNFLLNIGPKPDGTIPVEQQQRMREVALWNFINGEAVYGVEPWIVTNEDRIWFTKKRGEDTVYAIVTRPEWRWGSRRTVTLQSVKAGKNTEVSVLGQSGRVLEYAPSADPSARWKQTDAGLEISAVRAQRIYNDRKWPNAVVLKVTDAKAAVVPPRILTGSAKALGDGRVAFSGELLDLGRADAVEVGVQYRRRHENTQPLSTADPWQDGRRQRRTEPGTFTIEVAHLKPGQAYDYRVLVGHPQITLYGDLKGVTAR